MVPYCFKKRLKAEIQQKIDRWGWMYRGNTASPSAAAGKQWEAVLVFGACALPPSLTRSPSEELEWQFSKGVAI